MTGFASGRGQFDGCDWTWDIRSVNGRGLDLRLRVGEGVEGMVRGLVSSVVARGSVTVALKLARRGANATGSLDRAALAGVLTALGEVEAAAEAAGVTLRHSSAADILALRGVLDAGAEDGGEIGGEFLAALKASLAKVLAAFDAMRLAEGKALGTIIRGQLDRIEALTGEAAQEAAARVADVAAKLSENLARVLQNADGADPARVAQELALLAVKSDVTEEIDRLKAHVAAARKLLSATEPVGRKLDFLTQEFNREANTLCSKAGSERLTRVGLDLKHVIDQMREQVQNVE